MICKKCGTEYPSYLNCCPSCGQDKNDGIKSNQYIKKGNFYYLGLFLAIIGHIFGLLGLLACNDTEDKNKFVRGFITGIFIPIIISIFLIIYFLFID